MRTSVCMLMCLVVSGIAAAQPADFGDALMEPIPTLLVNGGPFHIDVTQEWIGSSPTSTTTTEADALPSDFNDGYIIVREVQFNGSFSYMGQVCVPVTTTATVAVRYLNVALDLNNDNIFASYPVGSHMQYEWVVVNLPIVFTDETKVVTSNFTLQQTFVPARGRATLSTQPIDAVMYGLNGWDGSGPIGGFSSGETEDFMAIPPTPYYYDSLPGSIQMLPPNVFYPPGNKPIPPSPVHETPRGPAQVGQRPDAPNQPGVGETPYTPESDAPPRREEPVVPPSPVIGHGSVKGMPDIKQGTDECVPTATANSLRYLYNKAGYTVPEGESDAFNKDLLDKLKAAMKTNQGGTGTQIDSENPAENNFINGKKNAKIPDVLRNGKVTTVQQNPTRENIKNAINNGENVEIVITRYNKDGTVAARHMVTVVGFVEHADGTIELKIHDPNDKKTGENAGDTIDPPREHTLIIKPGDPVKGGLEIRGMVRDGADHNNDSDGDTYVIGTMFTEHLAEEAISVTVDQIGEVTEDDPFELEAILWDKNKATATHYQWIKDDEDIPGANMPFYHVPVATLLDSGDYSCWAYDEVTETYGVSGIVTVVVVGDSSVPASGTLLLLTLIVLLGTSSVIYLTRKKQANL